MADFCKKCSIQMFGKDYRDIVAEPGGTLTAICEGHGRWITVDDRGDEVDVDESR